MAYDRKADVNESGMIMPVFIGVRGIGILGSSPFGHSRKFAFKEFSEVRRDGVLRSASWLEANSPKIHSLVLGC